MPLKDRVSPETRSRIMSKIRSKETRPEVDFRRGCRSAGLVGYRKNWGRPSTDVAWTRIKLAVFIDSCFWHKCPDHGKVPDSEYWRDKLYANEARDVRATEHYESRGWTVLRFWTHTPIEEMVNDTGRAIARLRNP